jgi:hypothetical protein
VLIPDGTGQRLTAKVGESIDPALLVRGVALPFCVVRGSEKTDMVLACRFTEETTNAEKRALMNDGKRVPFILFACVSSARVDIVK